MSASEALSLAQQQDLDLVEVSPNASPPVVKIIDWGKYQYEQTKKSSKQKKSGGGIKQMRFGIRIGENDMDIKLDKIRKFLSEGNKVRISIVFRGREMAHKDLGNSLIDKIMQKLENEATIDGKPSFAGRFLSVNIKPIKGKVKD